jgi:hypothetical protein
MRIAVSGAHRTGKTTLVDELLRGLASYVGVAEPYHLLEEEGHEFAEMPCLEDFELQLARSIQCIAEADADSIFDRCPADILAYLVTHAECEAFDVEHWLPRARRAMEQLDLIVFVPIEDRVVVADSDHAELRSRVDEELRRIVVEDRWEFGVETLEVTGSARERAGQVLARVTGERGHAEKTPE